MNPNNPLGQFFAGLAVELAARVIEMTAGRLRQAALGSPETQALRHVFEEAFANTLQQFGKLSREEQYLVEDILKEFVSSDEVAQNLIDLAIQQKAPPLTDLLASFEAVFVADLPVDFQQMMIAMMGALEGAVEVEASRAGSPLANLLVVRKLTTLVEEQRLTSKLIMEELADMWPQQPYADAAAESVQERLVCAIKELMARLSRFEESRQVQFNVTVGDIVDSSNVKIGVDTGSNLRDIDAAGLPDETARVLLSAVGKYQTETEQLATKLEKRIARLEQIRDPESSDIDRLHKRYLRRFFKPEFFHVSLAEQVTEPESQGVDLSLEQQAIRLTDIYVPLPVDMSVTIKVNDQDMRTIDDWWVKTERSETPSDTVVPEDLRGHRLKEWPLLVVGRAEMEVLIAEIQRKLLEREIDKHSFRSEQNWYLEAHDAACVQSRLVLTGNPGSGKSTFIKHLAVCMAGELLGNDPKCGGIGVKDLDFWAAGVLTPVFVTLHDLVETQFPNPGDKAGTAQFDAYLKRLLADDDNRAFWPLLKCMLEDGSATILMDGLDEVPDASSNKRRQQIQAFVSSLETDYGNCRFIVTSRPYAYNDGAQPWTLMSSLEGQRPFGQTTLVPLESQRVRQLADKLFRRTLPDGRVDEETKEFLSAVDRVAAQREGNRDLTNTPLLFTMMAALWMRNPDLQPDERLPSNPSRLYRECVDLMLEVWTRKDKVAGQSLVDLLGVSYEQLREALQIVAFRALKDGGTLHEDDRSALYTFRWSEVVDAIEEVRQFEYLPTYGPVVEFLAYRASLLTSVISSPKPKVLRFTHMSFQEHLAAVYLSAASRYPGEILERLRVQPGRWTGVVPLLAHEIADRHGDFQNLVKGLLVPEPDASLPLNHPQWELVGHVYRIIADHGVLLTGDDESRLRQWLLVVVGAGALNPRIRVEIGRTLSELGDPRPGVGIEDGLPDIDWVDIPGMKGYRLQTDDGDKGAYDISSFSLARYPLTHRQFQVFLEDGEGFHCSRWWAGLAAGEEHRGAPGEQAFKYDNHPRERVSWWDAMAFCAWLSARQGWPTLHEWAEEGKDWRLYPGVRLPTEWEWQYAAQGSDGREYPYVGDFDAGKGNTQATGIGQTCAVGAFPQGASPFGVLDMSGNVWEWCLNEYEQVGRTGLEGDASRALRGGSWGDTSDFARASYRGRDGPFNRNNLIGFRVARSCLTK